MTDGIFTPDAAANFAALGAGAGGPLALALYLLNQKFDKAVARIEGSINNLAQAVRGNGQQPNRSTITMPPVCPLLPAQPAPPAPPAQPQG